ncbi:hypothetical protein BUY46_11505 [Staphylococcus devriesei]|nr:hypothetical protein BUY46_11505 [Staphylococcus devriesei]
MKVRVVVMSDRLIDVTGGYGTIYKQVMKETNLSIEAKAIYCYLSSYAGGKDIAFPSVSLICRELNISKNRFYKHRNELVDKKIISVKRERTENGFSKNIYTINHHFVCRNFVDIQNVDIRNVDIQNVDIQNKDTKNNSIKKNSIKNNIEKKNSSSGTSATQQQPLHSTNVYTFYESNGFGRLNPTIVDNIDAWIEDFNGNEDIVIEALKEAAMNNVYKWAYVNSILKNWYQDNIKTVEDIEARRKQREVLSTQNKSENNFLNNKRKEIMTQEETFDNSQYRDLF